MKRLLFLTLNHRENTCRGQAAAASAGAWLSEIPAALGQERVSLVYFSLELSVNIYPYVCVCVHLVLLFFCGTYDTLWLNQNSGYSASSNSTSCPEWIQQNNDVLDVPVPLRVLWSSGCVWTSTGISWLRCPSHSGAALLLGKGIGFTSRLVCIKPQNLSGLTEVSALISK